MARTRDYYFGNDPETVTVTKSATYELDTKSRIRLDNDGFGYLLADIILYDTDGVTVIDPSNYTLYADDYYTEQEALPGGSDTTLYGNIEITNATYADVEIYISGLNFGSYTTNEASSGGGGGTYSPDYPYNYLDSDENVNPDIVWFPDNELWYSSKIDDNIGNPPTTGDSEDLYWQVEGGLSGVIQDFDFNIASVYEKAGSVATGEIALTDTRQALNPEHYPKAFARIGTTWGGDGTTTFYLPSIEDVQGKKYDPEWSSTSTWVAGASITIPHSLNDSFDQLSGEIFVRDPAVPDKIYTASHYFYNAQYFGQTLNGIDGDLNNCYLQITDKNVYVQDGGQGGIVPTTWEYKVIVTTKGYKELQDDMSLVIYVGNGSLSVVEDTSLDNRVTALESKLAVVKDAVEWERGESTDWSATTITINHNLNALPRELDVNFELTWVGSWGWRTVENIVYTGTTGKTWGLMVDSDASDVNNLVVKTGADGVIGFTDAGVPSAIGNGSTGNLRAHITAKASAPLIQTNFNPVKDWVEVWSGEALEVDPVENKWGEGKYRLSSQTASGEINTFSGVVDTTQADGITAKAKCLTFQSSAAVADQVFVQITDDGFSVDGKSSYGSTAVLTRIEKWQDAVGQNRPMKAITDGDEVVFKNWNNISDVSMSALTSQGAGDYTLLLSSSTAEDFSYESRIKISDVDADSHGSVSLVDTLSYNMRAKYSGLTTKTFQSLYPGYYIKEIWKDTGTVNLNVNQINRTIAGVPNTYVFQKDTSAGAIAMTASDTWLPTETGDTYPSVNNPLLVSGDLLVFYNSALLATSYLLTGLPRDNSLVSDSSITFRYDSDNFDFIPIVDTRTTCKAWVNFDGTGTPTIRDSFNVSSITDNGTGDYTVNFINPMNNANYATFICVGSETLNPVSYIGSCPAVQLNTTTTARMIVYQSHSLTAIDAPNISFQVFGT